VLGKYSFGIGDRFAKEGVFQLQAFKLAEKQGAEITPVWNKSFREHKTVGSDQSSVRAEADETVKKTDWKHSYLVDADHITFDTVDEFLPYSDFFTIDVANNIGQKLSEKEKDQILQLLGNQIGEVKIKGLDEAIEISEQTLIDLGHKFFKAAIEAGRIYRKIKKQKKDYFAVEVSMDEVDTSQTPTELYFILMFLTVQQVPVNTIAPKFTGRFNKGVDYKGNISAFEKEFEEDLLVIRHCIEQFGLPEDLKLSIHTGSDKFSLYPIMNRLVKKYDCGLHLKTAGTTWLEELIGLAESGGSGLEMAKSIYKEAYERFEELTSPYATVIEVDPEKIPKPQDIESWDGKRYAETLRHDATNSHYNPYFRQLLHTSYKLAAEKGGDFIKELEKNSEHIGRNVTENIFERHIKPLFL